MITFVRTRSIAPSKIAEAMAYAQQVAKLVNDKYGVPLRLNVPVGGNPDRVAFVSSHANLGEVEDRCLIAGGRVHAAARRQRSDVSAGATHDELWMSIWRSAESGDRGREKAR